MNRSLPPIPILMYHEIWGSTEGRIRHTNPAYVLTARNFSRQMHYLHDSGYRTLWLDEYLDGSLENERQDVIITFDDGWYNNYSQAFPVLRKLGLKATIFVVTDFIGQNYSYPEASYQEREEIKERHRVYQKGLMWTLAYHPRIPEHIRAGVSKYGMCKDEFERDDGWQL